MSESTRTMTESEFNRELARAWEEGYTAADYDAPHSGKSANPYDTEPPHFEAFPEPRGPWAK